MISFLRGTILNKNKNYVIIEVAGIGYQVFISPPLYAELSLGQDVQVYTHQYIREDSLDLYGFKTLSELEMFELLLSITGVGPKSALGILSISKIDELKESIARGDSHLLTKVSGIGRKTAERIILELREKIADFIGYVPGEDSGSNASSDEIDALISLGYNMQQAREALRQVDPKIVKSGERIREALKKLSRPR